MGEYDFSHELERIIMITNRSKIAVIGAGFVGASTAYALALKSLASEIVLIDINQDKAEGEARDIAHGMSFMGEMFIHAGGFEEVRDSDIIIVTAGDRKIDNAKYKAYFHVKAKMLTFDEACAFTGHAPGGVCSFALPENVKTYLDVSLKRFDTVFPAAGSANSAIEMTCDELEKYSSNFVAWVDVCKEKAPAPQA